MIWYIKCTTKRDLVTYYMLPESLFIESLKAFKIKASNYFLQNYFQDWLLYVCKVFLPGGRSVPRHALQG